MELPLLKDIVIILGLSVPIILVFQRLRLPSILGFLLTGIIVGPHGLNLIHAVHEVELMAEIGIIFLLFVIGIEFSLKGLSAIKNTVLIGGSLQVGLTVGAVAVATQVLGLPWRSAIFMGFLISLSSTAIVLKMLQENGELNSPHGRVSIGILIFQDIIVVFMMILTPLLAGEFSDPWAMLAIVLGKVTALVIGVLLLARYIVPILFRLVVRTKSQELFILTIIVLCFSTAWLTSLAGLSLALGAFFAGLIISESDYSHQATANILPFREIFISFFFVSVGMLLDFHFFIDHLLIIHLAAVGVVLLKMVVIAVAVFFLRYPGRTILLSSLALFQVGEFAFLLSTTGMQYELLSEDIYQYFLAISIITMGATPFVINYSPKLAEMLLRAPMPAPMRQGIRRMTGHKSDTSPADHIDYRDHLIIVGYGMNGENVAKAARKAQIAYVIVELDPEAIRRAGEKGHPVVYGDAGNETILKHVGIQRARVVVVAISAHESTRRIVRMVRSFTETAYIIVRTRYVREVEDILRLGADEVIPEEFETSIEIFTRVLKKYLVTNNEIRNFVNEIRSGNYEMLRGLSDMEGGFGAAPVHIPEMEIATLPVQKGKNKIVGKTIEESGLRSNYGITVLAIQRVDEYITDVTPEVAIQQEDVLYIFGRPDDIQRVNKYFTYSE